MAKRYTDGFRRDAVRMATTSGLTRPQLSSDLGVGLSTLNKWVQQHQHDDLMSGPHEDVEKGEHAASQRSPSATRGEGSVKKGGDLLCRPKPVRFAFIDAWKEEWPVEFLCKVMRVTSRGFRAWRVRPMSQRQRDDMVILAHIREQHRLRLESYGRPRITEELQEEGLNVGHRRVGRLMRENGIKIIRTQKYKVRRVKNLIRGIKFTDARRTAITFSTSHPICWIRIFPQPDRTKSGREISPTFGPEKVGCI